MSIVKTFFINDWKILIHCPFLGFTKVTKDHKTKYTEKYLVFRPECESSKS